MPDWRASPDDFLFRDELFILMPSHRECYKYPMGDFSRCSQPFEHLFFAGYFQKN